MADDRILHILKCPDCDGGMEKASDGFVCAGCGRSFPLTDEGIIRMMPLVGKPKPTIYDDPDYLRWQENASDALEEFWEGGSRLFKLIHDSAHRRVSRWNMERKSEGWIVDIGCGGGYHFQYQRNLKNVIGIDTNMDSLRKIKTKYPEATLLQADGCYIPIRDTRIAGVIAVHMLEHIYYLEDALSEIERILAPDGKLLVGLPCEGGLAWNTGRKFTSERKLSRKYQLDYAKVVSIEHCNTAGRVVDCLKERFNIDRRKFFPLSLVPLISLNLTLSLQLSKNK